MKVTVIPIVIGALGTVTKGLVKGLRGVGNKRTSGDHLNYSTLKISQNTEKSSGNLRTLVVAEAPAENHPLTMVWKALKGE